MNISPLGALAAIVVLGVSIELVERKSKNAAFALVLLLLLGIITFNNRAFSQQLAAIMAVLNRRSGGGPRSLRK